jgi:multiple sugar transport system ATP-binding protein
MATVELLRVSKVYGSVTVVDDVSLTVRDEEFVVLLGPSGCGKSTLLKLIAGLEDPSAGEIYIDGALVNYVPPVERDVSMVFQNYALYPHMSVADNIGFPLRMQRVPRDQISKRILEVAALLGIEQLLDRRPKALSGGQRQRVALGRAIIRQPKAFLMDEPLSNLDAKLRVQMREELMQLHERVRGTVIYVTHDQVEAMTMADRLVVLSEGRIQQVGPPQEVYDRPVNTYVATFVGSPAMNLVDGELSLADGQLRFTSPSIALPLPATMAASMADHGNRRVVLGVRSEDLLVEAPGGEGGPRATVRFVESIGSDVFVRLASGTEWLVARVPAYGVIGEGDVVTLSLRQEAIHLFDPQGKVIGRSGSPERGPQRRSRSERSNNPGG